MIETVRVCNHDFIPSGRFLAEEYTPERVAAIRRAIQLGEQIAETFPEVMEMYRDFESPGAPFTYLYIAEQIVPDEVVSNSEIASKAVGYAVRSLIPPDEQAELTAKRRALQLEERHGGFGSDQHSEHQRKAARRRHEEHGVDTEAMIRGRGQVPWGDEEKQIVLEWFIHDSEFQHQSGSARGRPNYSLIAHTLNELYHDGESVRYTNSVGSLVRYERQRKKRIEEDR